MSKMDGLRAMREARYAEAAARAKTGAPGAKRRRRRSPRHGTGREEGRREAPGRRRCGAAEALCGHRNMSGRTCTREHGHAAKSHRYS